MGAAERAAVARAREGVPRFRCLSRSSSGQKPRGLGRLVLRSFAAGRLLRGCVFPAISGQQRRVAVESLPATTLTRETMAVSVPASCAQVRERLLVRSFTVMGSCVKETSDMDMGIGSYL